MDTQSFAGQMNVRTSGHCEKHRYWHSEDLLGIQWDVPPVLLVVGLDTHGTSTVPITASTGVVVALLQGHESSEEGGHFGQHIIASSSRD